MQIPIVRTPGELPVSRSIDNNRWMQSIPQECLDHFLVFGPQHFDHLISEYVDYYHTERPHQSLDKRRFWSWDDRGVARESLYLDRDG